ncbi:Uma2 family endonuclease [bacterium]|nr:MAG: Uma2 family endonuclease [bacterium]
MAKPTILSEIEESEVWQWTSKEVLRAIEAGILKDAQHYELIEGRLIRKMAKGEIHIRVHSLLFRALMMAFGPEYDIRSEAPVSVSQGTEPEPDFFVIKLDRIPGEGGRPDAEQGILAIEISVSSQKGDLGWKRDLYASAGLPEYWVIDADVRKAFIHRRPEGGEYRSLEVLHEGDDLPRLGIRLSDVLTRSFP